MFNPNDLPNRILPSEIKIGYRIIIDGKEIEIDERMMGKLFKPANGWMLQRLQGIQLTPVWLQRCGFTPSQDEEEIQYYSREDCPIDFQAEAGSDKFEQVNPILSYKLQYVHQLQNLFHAIVGEELKIERP